LTLSHEDVGVVEQPVDRRCRKALREDRLEAGRVHNGQLACRPQVACQVERFQKPAVPCIVPMEGVVETFRR
jgi:hypothetical protein